MMTLEQELEKYKEYTESRRDILKARVEKIDHKVVGEMVQISALAATCLATMEDPNASEHARNWACLALSWAIKGAGL